MDYHHEFDVQMLHEISLSKQLNIYIIIYYIIMHVHIIE